MLFTMNRSFTVKGFGHSLKFEKGVPKHVPAILHNEVRKYGGIPVDGEVEDKTTTNTGEPKKTRAGEPQGEERAELILIACKALAEENDSRKFGGNGAPSVQAVSDNLGFRVDATERTTAWQTYNQRIEAEREPSNITQPVIDDTNDSNT